MSPVRRFRIIAGIIMLLSFADCLLLLPGDTKHSWLPIVAALLGIFIVGLAIYAGFMIRCPRCSTRVTALIDTRDGKPRGSTLPPPICRFCGCDLTERT